MRGAPVIQPKYIPKIALGKPIAFSAIMRRGEMRRTWPNELLSVVQLYKASLTRGLLIAVRIVIRGGTRLQFRNCRGQRVNRPLFKMAEKDVLSLITEGEYVLAPVETQCVNATRLWLLICNSKTATLGMPLLGPMCTQLRPPFTLLHTPTSVPT
jgi:hypothetical protein